ncbi:UDP-N-acetyl-D-mannosaminuronic acid dehydrogenase [Paenibacillus forsythiae]|uniref:UDP-N-acetyl-D-mannosaminuronic acid dehydrogenase n=1 Tax=Paenibacillus forsythiae TaxID=365616 RepID=A0ABU3HDH6_9BACL|nr:nucleotide sugar dehydrogenase [Paenibacillus forsythiae]MDT3428869.1 UDP-N-acetyl-D-mannosaminuronic acid dehydrogenase [Paenibacillus forsythiae]
MKICILGLGYIGLPTAVIFSRQGFQVVGVDVQPKIVEMINAGEVHIEEPGLPELVKGAVEQGNLFASSNPEPADVFIIAVPTPNLNDTYKSCDLSFVLQATKDILPFLRNGNVVIIESTIAPRSMDDYIKPLIESAGFVIGEDVYLVHCPERVMPGKIMEEIVYNNRIVGGITPACAQAAAEVYGTFVKGEIIQTNAKTAEMTKLMENTFRDVNIALSNELVKVCNDLEINALEVIQMANKHPRVNLHQPGPGVGGHCLAVDPYFIEAKSPDLARIIHLARETNSNMPQYVAEHVGRLLPKNNGMKIAVFGLTYKADIDDMRESPAVKVVDLLLEQGYHLGIYDPHVNAEMSRYPLNSLEETVNEADLLLLLTDHSEFKYFDYNFITRNMRNRLIFDTRNCIDPSWITHAEVVDFGNLFEYLNRKSAALA